MSRRYVQTNIRKVFAKVCEPIAKLRKLIFANYRRNHYEKLWLTEFLHLRINTTLTQALAEKTNLNALVLL